MLRRLLIGLAALAMAGVASAQVTYTYTGAPYTLFGQNVTTNNPYALGDFASGSFTVSSALADGTYSLFGSNPSLSYLFSDGVYSYSSASASDVVDSYNFEVSVTSGAITDWKIYLTDTGNNPYGTSYLILDKSQSLSFGQVSPTAGGDAYAFSASGTWTESVSAVPEPSTYAMLLSGLVVLGFVSRRNRGNAPALAA
jgi:hypothetical protein